MMPESQRAEINLLLIFRLKWVLRVVKCSESLLWYVSSSHEIEEAKEGYANGCLLELGYPRCR
jgi:hypothetical protein